MRGRRSSRQAFPVALYASLLVALLCLVRPEAARTFQSACATLQCLPLRAQGFVAPRTARAADARAAEDRATIRAHVDALRARRDVTASIRPPGVGAEWQPVVVGVRAREVGGSRGSALVLDADRRAVDGAASFVTVGDAVVGFLDERAVSSPDLLAGSARVLLLGHVERGRLPRRVPAEIVDGAGCLGVVVEPAAPIDRWPLRCVLPEDPYAAAALPAAPLLVRTRQIDDDPLGALPPGLRVGTLRIYGYEEPGGRVLPIGLFVEPVMASEALHAVVVWMPAGRRAPPSQRPLERGVLHAVRALRLPVPTAVRERMFVTTQTLAGAFLRGGAAVVAGERLIGELDVAGLGYGVVAPFGQPGRPWPMTLLPDGGGAPIDVVAHGVARQGAVVFLGLDTPIAPGFRGQAFSGAGGMHMPAGLWIGDAVVRDAGELLVRHVDPAGGLDTDLAVHLFGGTEGAR